MARGTFIRSTYILGISTLILGAYVYFTNQGNAYLFFATGIASLLVFIALSIYEVNTSRRIDRTSKAIWTIGFILMSGITGLIYLLSGRKRIVRHSHWY
jgi:hypothetical protein